MLQKTIHQKLLHYQSEPLQLDETNNEFKLNPFQNIIVICVQVFGICVHCLLLVFLFHNLFKYVIKLRQKPFTILVFYFGAAVTLLALITAFSVIRNPSNNTEISIEFSSLFVAEWGIQIAGASQACSALELVLLMRAIFTSDESKSRAKFQKMRRYMNIGLFVLCLVIVTVPI